MKASEVLGDLKRRFPNEPEYHQAVSEVLLTIEDAYNEHPEFEKSNLIERLCIPDRIFTFRVSWMDDKGRIQTNMGYRIQHNNAIGPYKGGVRFHSSVNLSILKFLAFEQTFKNSLTTLPMGGAKGGSDFNPRGKSNAEVMDFLDKNNNFGVQIYISDERDYLLDTGGGIKNASVFLRGNEPFLVHNVDILSDVDLNKLYQSHIETGSLATLLVSCRAASRQLLFNKENRMCGWQNIKTEEVKSFYPEFDPRDYKSYAFSGIHVISPKIFEFMDEWTGRFSIIDFYVSACVKSDIHAYVDDNQHLIDIGKPENLLQAEAWLKSRTLE